MLGRLVSYWGWHTFRDYVSFRECNSSTFCRVSWLFNLFLEDSSSLAMTAASQYESGPVRIPIDQTVRWKVPSDFDTKSVGFSGTHKDMGPPKMVSGTHTIPISIRDSYGNSMGPKGSHWVHGNLTDHKKMPSLIFLPVVNLGWGEILSSQLGWGVYPP